MSRDQQPVAVVSDTLTGVSAAAINRLMDGLAALPLAVERWHFSPSRHVPVCPGEVSLDPRRKRPPLERLLKNVSRRPANHLRRRRHEAAFCRRVQAIQPALINLHNIHTCGLNHDSLLRLPPQIPLIWTLHDCWPFRSEAFLWENSSLRSVEAICLDEPKLEAMRRRRAFFEQRPGVVLVAPSKWMAAEARASAPEGMRIERIPYGVCLKAFAPLPSDQVRSQLNLDPQRTWLGYSSTRASTRKGTDILLRALRACLKIAWSPAARDFGGGQGGEAGASPPRAVTAEPTPATGKRPAAIQEALAAKGDWPRYRQACRQIAEAEYGLAIQAMRYVKLFNELRHSGQC